MADVAPAAGGASPISNGARGPTVSVIVNTCDRCEALKLLLDGLSRQSSRNFEVVVVVGPTQDTTHSMLAADFSGRVTVVECDEFNLSVSRNRGLENAAGEIVAFIDDDAVPCSTWVDQIAAAYEDPDIAGAGGRTYNVLPEAGELQFLCGVFSVVAEQDDVRETSRRPVKSTVASEHWFPRLHGTNMSYRKEVLFGLGGFDERYEYLFDDADIAARLKRQGHRVRHLRQAAVYHRPGLGRNRGRHRYDLNWYCWSRSAIYFALKNGGPTVGRRKSLVAAFRIASTFRAHVDHLREQREMPEELHRKARAMLRKGLREGLSQGVFGRRRIPGSLRRTERQFLPFGDKHAPSNADPHLVEVGSQTRGSTMREHELRVCLLSVGYPPEDTHGVSRSTHTLARGLVELGHEVHVVTAGRRNRVVVLDGAYIHQVDGAANNRYAAYASTGYVHLANWLNHSHAVADRVRSLAQDHSIDVVDSPLWNLDGLVTAVAGNIPVAVRVVTAMKQIAAVHGRESDETRILADLESKFLDLASAVVSNSSGTVQTLGEVYGFDTDAPGHFVVPYGIIPAADEMVPKPGAGDSDQLTVLFVGRLEGRKGILDLFDSIPTVLDKAPQTRFQIVGGDNSGEDGFKSERGMDYASFFRKAHPDLCDRVDFLGFVGEERLQQLYRECDVFVAPSLYESFGLIFLEAMNYGRPVVGCRAGGPQDIIVDGETGLLVPPSEPEALAQALLRLIADTPLRTDLGRAGRRRLVDTYSHVAMAEGFVEVYRAMIDRGQGAGPTAATAERSQAEENHQ